jgi:thioredoxin reductase
LLSISSKIIDIETPNSRLSINVPGNGITREHKEMHRQDLPVVVIGAGPVGLAAATHLLEQGLEPIVIESGSGVGASVLSWAHVRLFSPWKYVVDEAAGRLLEVTGWTAPDPEAYPTGGEIVEQYLRPLAETPALRDRVRTGQRVISVARAGFDKMKSEGREDVPFVVSTVDAAGNEKRVIARAVIDASGTSAMPNPAGAGGVPAIGERALRDKIFYGIPDVLGSERARYAGKRVLVIGSGHSAFNALLDLVDLADDVPGTAVSWAIRKPAGHLQNLFGGGINDALPARGELGARVRRLVEQGRLRLETSFRAMRMTSTSEGIVVAGEDNVLAPVDEIIVATGLRPDLSFLSEIRLALDPVVESPVALAPLIDPNVHSCGSVPPHGAEELKHPETDFYIVGMKSYGRAPTFLMLTGYEQVRSVAAAIAGDWEAAREVRLILPETGVCSSGILSDRGVTCCSASAEADETVAGSCCEPAGDPGAGACCGSAVPQVIQLASATKGGCCV